MYFANYLVMKKRNNCFDTSQLYRDEELYLKIGKEAYTSLPGMKPIMPKMPMQRERM